jgi:4-oxalocrotonate tautomerase
VLKGEEMPHIDIKMLAGRTDEKKKEVAEAVIEAMMESLGCERSHLSVAVHDIAPEKWNEEVKEKVDASKVYAGEVFEMK